MNRDEFKEKLLSDIDAALKRTWVITGDNRRLLKMARQLVSSATDDELDRMMALYPEGD